MTDETADLKHVEWRLAVLMAERGIRTATELHRRLLARGITISSDRISRIIDRLPDRLNTEVLVGLMTVLECSASDLIRETSEPSPSTEKRPGKDSSSANVRPLRPASKPRKPPAASAKHGTGSVVTKRAASVKDEALSVVVDEMLASKLTALPVKPRS